MSAPIARSRTRATKSLTTLKLTSASSRASRTSRIATSTSASLTRPRPVRLASVARRRSLSASNMPKSWAPVVVCPVTARPTGGARVLATPRLRSVAHGFADPGHPRCSPAPHSGPGVSLTTWPVDGRSARLLPGTHSIVRPAVRRATAAPSLGSLARVAPPSFATPCVRRRAPCAAPPRRLRPGVLPAVVPDITPENAKYAGATGSRSARGPLIRAADIWLETTPGRDLAFRPVISGSKKAPTEK